MSNTEIAQFGHTGMLSRTNSAEQVSDEEYHFHIKLNLSCLKPRIRHTAHLNWSFLHLIPIIS
jgi:hypothetical protein